MRLSLVVVGGHHVVLGLGLEACVGPGPSFSGKLELVLVGEEKNSTPLGALYAPNKAFHTPSTTSPPRERIFAINFYDFIADAGICDALFGAEYIRT